MNAGDEQTWTYNVYDSASSLVDLNAATCEVKIFPYGDTGYTTVTLPGTVTGSPLGQFTANFTSACSIDLSGVYQQKVFITDYTGDIHVPSQGKIYIFPSPNN